ncbi:MAG: sulfatase-like hydrolase/transferase [Gammaproteobacteria bacterium]|nr:sulfatase-like hydrolase/transferase [Gammaproteobacteria bacterium]
MITDDQHRGDCLGIEGHPVLSTPNLDWIGASGTTSGAASEVLSCIAARRILLTGMNQDHTGLVGYRDNLTGTRPRRSAACWRRRATGRSSAANSIWRPTVSAYGFQNMVWSDGYGGGCDYEAYLVREGQDEPQARLSHGVDVNGWVGRPWHLEERYTYTYWTASESVRFLETRDLSCPFFLHTSMVDPHPPLTPPQSSTTTGIWSWTCPRR